MNEEPTRLEPPIEAAPGEIAVGSVLFSTYVVDRHLSTGGMGDVYAAHSRVNNARYAIKVIKASRMDDPRVRDLFVREGEILQRIRSGAVVSYAGQLQDDAGRCHLVMEFVDGPSLAHRLRTRPLDAAAGTGLLRRLARGLGEVHAAGTFHRDLSPDNILLPDDDLARAVIIDFGIAKLKDPDQQSFIGSDIAGKLGYMAPEQMGLFDGAIDARTDIYALGLVVAAAVRGAPLLMGNDLAEAMRARRSVPDLGDVPTPLRDVLAAMLQPDPADRPASMEALLERLDREEAARPPPAARTGRRDRATKPKAPRGASTRKRPGLVVPLSLAALAVVGGTAAWLSLTDPFAVPSAPELARDTTEPNGPRSAPSPDPEPWPSPAPETVPSGDVATPAEPSGTTTATAADEADAPPAPAPAPPQPPDAATVRAALPAVACGRAEVAGVSDAGVVTLAGTVARAADVEALGRAAAGVTGVRAVQTDEVAVVADTVCLAQALVDAHADPSGVTLTLNQEDGAYADGDTFVIWVELAEPVEGHLQVDLFGPPDDSGQRLVYHLHPRPDAPASAVAGETRLQLGRFAFQSQARYGPQWLLGPPFGGAVVTAVVTEAPVLSGDELTDSQPAPPYLERLGRALRTGAPAGTAVTLQVSAAQ